MLKKKYYYLAYGSNLNLKEMSFRCPNAKPIGTVLLPGYHLIYKGVKNEYAYLTIEAKDDSFVPLGLFEVTRSDIKSLDKYEGYPLFYEKRIIPLTIDNKKIKALIYIMKKEYDYHLPLPSYIKTCKDGYTDFGFDHIHLDIALQKTIEKIPKTKIRK